MYRVAYATKIIVVLTATLVGSVDFVYAVSVPHHSSWNAISKSKLITQIASQYSERTAETQRALKALGHYSGEIDGISGPQTFDAIREFQHNNLKSSPTGHLGKYEREVLISLGRSAVENQKNQALIENFELFDNTDFPGDDILTPVEDTTLRGLTVQECSARCIETHGCRSFTFNQNRNWCYLKGEHTTRGPFQNAVSGILNPLESTKEAEWKAPDNLDPRIADYPERLAAYRYAGKCNDETELIREGQSQTKVDVNVSSPRVGDKGIIQWSSSQEPTSLPVYIIVSASAPVRFSGAGFYALTPNARAPFSIDTYQETTRVIVPLYGKDVPKEGEITLLPIQTGELELKWRIVGYLRGCGEILHSQEQSLNITVRPGKPSIYVQDPFSLIEPKQRFVSASRDHTLQVFDRHYRVVNRDGEAVIQSREGKEPRFSNTGRFVTARLEEGVEILDVYGRANFPGWFECFRGSWVD